MTIEIDLKDTDGHILNLHKDCDGVKVKSVSGEEVQMSDVCTSTVSDLWLIAQKICRTEPNIEEITIKFSR